MLPTWMRVGDDDVSGDNGEGETPDDAAPPDGGRYGDDSTDAVVMVQSRHTILLLLLVVLTYCYLWLMKEVCTTLRLFIALTARNYG